MADIQQLEDQIVSLSLLEASELVKKLEERLAFRQRLRLLRLLRAAARLRHLRPKRRPSSPSSSRMRARTRSTPSRPYAKSPLLGSRKPRTWSMARPRR